MRFIDIHDLTAARLVLPVRSSAVPEIVRKPGELWAQGHDLFGKSGDATVELLRLLTDQDLGVTVPPLNSTGFVDFAFLPPSLSSGVSAGTAAPVGTFADWAGSVFNIPSGYLLADGSPVSRSVFPTLLAALIFTDTGNMTAGSDVIAGMSALRVAAISPGCGIEGGELPAGVTVVAILSANSIQISVTAPATISAAALTLFPWGTGDGTTTFNLPSQQASGVVGDWIDGGPIGITAVTTNPTKPSAGSIVRDRAMYRMVGDTMEFHFEYEQFAAGNNGSGVYMFTLPGGKTIDSAKMYPGNGSATASNATRCIIGQASLGFSGQTFDQVPVAVACAIDATRFIIPWTTDASQSVVYSGSFGLGTASLYYSVRGSVPILGASTKSTRIIKVQ